MKEDKQQKPVYESPKVLKLDGPNLAYGNGALDCNDGSSPGESCSNGFGASGCGNAGSGASSSCGNLGNSATLNCANVGNTERLGR